MNLLRERHGQALVKYDISTDESRKPDARYEWWINTKKMKDGVKLEEMDGKTQIYCLEFIGRYKEYWLMEEFDRRIPKHIVI